MLKNYAFLYLISILALSTEKLNAQSSPSYVRHASLSPDAETLAFGFQGDIWLYSLKSKQTNRLTIHEAYESRPHFSDDGSTLSFSSDRFGSNDIFTVDRNGGFPQRLTYHSASDKLSDWHPELGLIFSTERNFVEVEWDQEIHALSPQGGTPQRLFDALGDQAVVSPGGKYVAFVRGSCRYTRENYRGPANNEIWIYDLEEKSFKQLSVNQVNDILPRWKDDKTLLYLSSIEGRYNVVEREVALGSEVKILTNFKDEGVQHFDYAAGKLVLQKGPQLLLQSAEPNATPSIIELNLPSDYRIYPEQRKSYTADASAFAISPDGKTAALEIRGEIFITELDSEKSRTQNISKHAYYDREPLFINDSLLLFTSDRENSRYNFYIAQSSDERKTALMQSLRHSLELVEDKAADQREAVLSPDGKQLAFIENGTALKIADINEKGKLKNERTLFDAWHGAGGLAWSPDSRYIAYHRSNLNFNSEIYIQPVEAGEAVNVSMHPGGDYNPVWSADGSKLAFISDRNDDDYDLWYAWLKREDWLKSASEHEDGYYFELDEKGYEKEEEDAEKETVAPLEIDLEGIHERLEQLTSLTGNESNPLISKDGKTFYFTSYNDITKKFDLYKIKYDRSDLEQVTKGGLRPSNMQWAPDMEGIYFLSSGKLHHLNVSNAKITTYPHRAELIIDHKQERAQVFDEAWRMLRDRFYDPDFHGQDWESLRDYYRPWALGASTGNDFREVFNLMLGRLNASHLGLYGSDPGEKQRERTGLLGVEVKSHSKGAVVTKVVPLSPADREKNRLQLGDIITSVNGEKVDPNKNFYAYLNETAEQALLMEVERDGEKLELVIYPTRSLSAQHYEAWVNTRKDLVDKYSKGRLGYIHIKGMDKRSFERFERELMASGYGKEGIVIDVRFNGGGWTTDYLMAVLNVEQHAYTVPRGATDDLTKDHSKFKEFYPYSERLPLAAWTKPSIALCNESSYSNAEIFSHAYKSLGIGTLVGQPTFGAVISTGGSRLLDGSFVRLPFRGWYVKSTSQNMENGPAVPDVLVENPPSAKADGEDPQLYKAVEILIEQLDAKTE